jgi:CelD/BcsL family acetyltransferase involved in cellulose biosynthesis
MKLFGKVMAFGFAAAILTGAALAQTPAPASPTAAPSASAPAGKHPQSAHSLECSKEADAKGVHGKARKKFREECKKGQAGEAQ